MKTMKTKNEVFENLLYFKSLVENRTSKILKVLRPNEEGTTKKSLKCFARK